MSEESAIPQNFARNFPDGALCGCDCGCDRFLNDGNVMGEVVEADEHMDVVLLLCADCYVGSHCARSPQEDAQ